MRNLSFDELLEKRMAKIDEINKEPNKDARWLFEYSLRCWMDGLEDCGVNTGMLLLASDLWQVEHGNYGPMCCGIFISDHPKYVKDDQ